MLWCHAKGWVLAPSVCALQIVFLVLELGTFISGVLFGLCHLCRLRPEKLEKVSDMAHRLRVSSKFPLATAPPPLSLRPYIYPRSAALASLPLFANLPLVAALPRVAILPPGCYSGP